MAVVEAFRYLGGEAGGGGGGEGGGEGGAEPVDGAGIDGSGDADAGVDANFDADAEAGVLSVGRGMSALAVAVDDDARLSAAADWASAAFAGGICSGG